VTLSNADESTVEIDDAPRFEDGWSRAKAVLVGLLALFVLAGLAGVFGRGPLSMTSAAFASGRMEWERFARRQTAGPIIVRFETRSRANPAEVTLDRALLDRLTVAATHPTAQTRRASAMGETFAFALGEDRRGVVTFEVEPSRMGLVRGAVRVEGETIPVRMMVWP
jgi:hypothetical protein